MMRRPRVLELTAADELVALENLGVLQQNGFEVVQDDDQPAGRRLKLLAQPVSKKTEFDVQGKIRLRLSEVFTRLTWASRFGDCRSGGDLTFAEGSTLRDARALVQDARNVCNAGLPQKHHGRCAIER